MAVIVEDTPINETNSAVKFQRAALALDCAFIFLICVHNAELFSY